MGPTRDQQPDRRMAALKNHNFARYVRGNVSFQQQRIDRVTGFLEWLDVDVDEFNPDELFKEYLALYETSWVAYPDALGVLDEVQRMGLPVGVLTNGSKPQQEAKLQPSDYTTDSTWCWLPANSQQANPTLARSTRSAKP